LVVVLLPGSSPKPGVAELVVVVVLPPPSVPAVLATPGAALAALPRAGMEPEIEFRPGRALAAGLLAAGRVKAAQRDRGVLRLRERGGGDAHRQDGRRCGAPEQNSPVIHEALHFDVVIAENMARLVKLTVKLTAGHSAGNLTPAGRTRDRSAPPRWLRSYGRRREPDKTAIPAVNSPCVHDRSIPAWGLEID
jgi:hypothetical protein